ncbi:hypothetical protein [Actinomadura sp. 9N407]|uniref:hypothetical protein n=1 Tax=Actinomadura sp. 9N407 TaxID=3375154 RepID=UPI00379B24C9
MSRCTPAVASSSAAPGYAAPITIGGRDYMDGAFGGDSNVNLAGGAGTVILIEPIGHVFPGAPAEVELRIGPDDAALEAIGPDVGDQSRWAGAYKAGLRQSADFVDRIAPLLP